MRLSRVLAAPTALGAGLAACALIPAASSAAATCRAANPSGSFPAISGVRLSGGATCRQARTIAADLQREVKRHERTGLRFPAHLDGFRCRYEQRDGQNPYFILTASRGRSRVTMVLSS